ncbi:TPA: tRNA 2-selenouridine synthase, partial [Campylobacter coli]|nr:tRNA 2-selenouridine synthase [Campylobacter coli]
MKEMSLGDDFWDQLKVIEKKFPQILSNGCKYYRNDYNYDVKDPDYDFNF